LFVSTDYVFDGEDAEGYAEDAPVSPVNVYGVSKAAGERLVRLADHRGIVVRGSSLFGHAGSSGKGGNFVETVLARAAAGELISVVDDVVMSPTCSRDMAERILALLDAQAPPGIYHAANAGSCSWYQFARAAFELSGQQASLSPRASQDGTVRRPRCSVLLDTKSRALGLPPARPWREALDWYLATRPAHVPAPAGGS
jgi:dTDP-4-dehydrorhamnose reductase